MNIVQYILDEANVNGSIDAPYLVRAALIANALDSGNLSPEKIAAVIAKLPGKPSQFWRLAATAAANLHDPATGQIVDALADHAAKHNGPKRETFIAIKHQLRAALPSSNPA